MWRKKTLNKNCSPWYDIQHCATDIVTYGLKVKVKFLPKPKLNCLVKETSSLLSCGLVTPADLDFYSGCICIFVKSPSCYNLRSCAKPSMTIEGGKNLMLTTLFCVFYA